MALGSVIMSPLGGRLGDRFGHRHMLAFGTITPAAATLCSLSAIDAWTMCLAIREISPKKA